MYYRHFCLKMAKLLVTSSLRLLKNITFTFNRLADAFIYLTQKLFTLQNKIIYLFTHKLDCIF